MSEQIYFGKHPNQELQNLFLEKPYQGQYYEEADFIFLGQDANFGYNIHNEVIFEELKEYLRDGVLYWKKYKKHHPFISNNYSDAGDTYHGRFTKLNLDSSYADRISFLEIINVPTFNITPPNYKDKVLKNELNKKLQKQNKQTRSELIDKEHIKKIESLIFENKANKQKTIFIYNECILLLQKHSSIFKNTIVNVSLKNTENGIITLYEKNNIKLVKINYLMYVSNFTFECLKKLYFS